MKIKKIILLFTIFILTGCYDNKELNDIAILTATEINKINNNFIINAQVVNPQAPDKSSNIEAPFIIYTGTGKTIQEAYRQIKLSSSRYIYPEHLQIVIINENIAKEDITQILDFYLRDPSIRTEFNVLIGKDENIISTTTPIDQISSSSILKTLETNNRFQGVTNLTTLNELTIMSLNPNTEIILPSIKIDNINDESDTTQNTDSTKVNSMYKLSGLAIFKNNKLLDYLTDNESFSYNIIKNHINSSIITYECEKDKYLSAEIISSKSKITTKNQKINIDINIKATINESACNLNLNHNNNLKLLENNLSTYLENNISNDINTIRNKYNSDVFGFLDEIYKHDYKTYLKVKDNWYNETYKTIPININTKINIISKGNIMEGNNEKN
jgi:spore germination protein KC